MEIMDKGVLDGSFINNVKPTEFASETLYYTHNYGHFICDDSYSIQRDYDDSFLMFYVLDGELTFEVSGKERKLYSDNIGILDCKEPHKYYCDNRSNFLWFHFSGSGSQNYYNYLNKINRTIFNAHKKPIIKSYFEKINYQISAIDFDEHSRSLDIQFILSQAASLEKNNAIAHSGIRKSIEFIHKNHMNKIELNDLSNISNISVPHLIRLFKEHLRCTPHEYILSYRLKQSCLMLRETTLTIEIIAEKCGFNSASHYTRAFKSLFSMTPRQFRFN